MYPEWDAWKQWALGLPTVENSSSNGEGRMKTSVILALFGFVLAVGFSVALTENELAETADEYEAEKLRG